MIRLGRTTGEECSVGTESSSLINYNFWPLLPQAGFELVTSKSISPLSPPVPLHQGSYFSQPAHTSEPFLCLPLHVPALTHGWTDILPPLPFSLLNVQQDCTKAPNRKGQAEFHAWGLGLHQVLNVHLSWASGKHFPVSAQPQPKEQRRLHVGLPNSCLEKLHQIIPTSL